MTPVLAVMMEMATLALAVVMNMAMASNTPPGVVERPTAMQGSGTRGHDGGCLARNDGNPGTSSHNKDCSSYLRLLASMESPT